MDFLNLSSAPHKILPNKPKASFSKKLRSYTLEEDLLHSSTKDPEMVFSTQENPKEIQTFDSNSESFLSSPKADFLMENIAFKQEKDFNNIDYCGVCGLDFSSKFGLKVFKKKFCFICGYSTCGVCSKRKINGKRSCDLCLLRLRSKNAENRKKELLFLAEKKIDNFKLKIEENKTLKISIMKETSEIKEKAEKEYKEQNKAIEALEKTLESKKILEFETFQRLKAISEEFQGKKKEEKQRKQEFEEISKITEYRRKQLLEIKASYDQKLHEFQQLKKHQENLERSESFISMIKSRSLNSNEKNINTEIHTNEKKTSTNKKSNIENIERSYSYKERKSSILAKENSKEKGFHSEVKGGIIQCYPYPC